jgi:Predicted permeases
VQKFNYHDSKSEILNFDNYVFNLNENQKGSTSIRWKPKERYLDELINPQDDYEDSDLKKYRAELHERFTYPLLPLTFSMIAAAFYSKRAILVDAAICKIIIFAILTATAFSRFNNRNLQHDRDFRAHYINSIS